MERQLTANEVYILQCALRYQLRQNTFGAVIVAEEIIRNVPRMAFHHVDKMFTEILDAYKELDINPADKKEWDKVTKALWTRLNQPYDLPAVR